MISVEETTTNTGEISPLVGCMLFPETPGLREDHSGKRPMTDSGYALFLAEHIIFPCEPKADSRRFFLSEAERALPTLNAYTRKGLRNIIDHYSNGDHKKVWMRDEELEANLFGLNIQEYLLAA